MATQKWTTVGIVPPMPMAGVALFEDGGGTEWIPTGDYVAKLVSKDVYTKQGQASPSSIFFRLTLVEAAQPHNAQAVGKTGNKALGTAVNEGNARNWKQAYASIGATLATLEQVIQPNPEHFPDGKLLYIHVDSPPQAEAQSRQLKMEDIDIVFLQPSTYQTRKAQASAGGAGAPNGAAAAPSGFSPTSAAPAMPGAPVTAQSANGAPASMFSAPPVAPPAAPAGAPSFG